MSSLSPVDELFEKISTGKLKVEDLFLLMEAYEETAFDSDSRRPMEELHPFMHACFLGKLDMVQVFYSYCDQREEEGHAEWRSYFFEQDSLRSRTALHYAIASGKIDLVKFLLDQIKEHAAEACLEIQDGGMRTPATFAVELHPPRWEVIECWLEKGLPTPVHTERYEDMLLAAVSDRENRGNNQKVIEWLLDRGDSPLKKSGMRQVSPLNRALYYKSSLDATPEDQALSRWLEVVASEKKEDYKQWLTEGGAVIPPFLTAFFSRGFYALIANFCLGVMPLRAIFGLSLL